MRIGVVAVLALVTAAVTGGAAARPISPLGCEPAGPANCTTLIETLTVPAGGAKVTTATVFQKTSSYKLVISGSVNQANEGIDYDAFYCFAGKACTPAHQCGVCLLDVNGAGLPGFGLAKLYSSFAGRPPYAPTHTYSIPFSKDSAVNLLSG